MSKEQLLFAVFCVESVAEKLELGGETVYKKLARDSKILDEYIIPFERGFIMTADNTILQIKYAGVIETFVERAQISYRTVSRSQVFGRAGAWSVPAVRRFS